MKNKKYSDWTTISFIAIGIAVLLIILSFFAPIIFTQASSKWNFTETGQIGDTIGGIMSPFIAIGGVIMTFLAFYMQVKANRLQREQFLKGLNKDRVDEKIDCYYKLNLLKIDLEKIIKDIPDRVKGLNAFVEAEKENPFILNPLIRRQISDYETAKEINRLDFYKSFKYFLSDNGEWVKNFQNLFAVLNYLPIGFGTIYSIVDNHLKEIFEIKDEVRKRLIALEKKCVSLLNINNDSQLHLTSNVFMVNFLKNYRAEIMELLEVDKPSEVNMRKILTVVSNFSNSVEEYFNVAPGNYYKELCDIVTDAAEIAIKLNSIPPKSLQVIVSIESFVSILMKEGEGVYGKLGEILALINSGAEKYSIEDIRKEYDVLPQ
jgi:hypothetical protein BACCOPRO_00712